MQLNECINYLLSKAQKNVTQRFAEKLGIVDVTPVQYGVWKCLCENGTLTPSQIAQMLSVDTSTITGLLDRLENKRLLKRTPDPDDRRALKVSLTQNGRELEDKMEQLTTEAHNEVLSVFSEEEQTKLMEYLNRIIKSMNS
jgi:DNA-binding MarR family transcriptional regulator